MENDKHITILSILFVALDSILFSYNLSTLSRTVNQDVSSLLIPDNYQVSQSTKQAFYFIEEIIINVKLGELPEETYVKRLSLEKESIEIDINDLGLSITSTENNEGVSIVKIQGESNLFLGDIVKEVNRESVTTVDSFVELIKRFKKTGRNSILLKIIRSEKSLWITIKFQN